MPRKRRGLLDRICLAMPGRECHALSRSRTASPAALEDAALEDAVLGRLLAAFGSLALAACRAMKKAGGDRLAAPPALPVA